MTFAWALGDDLPRWAVVGACLVGVATLVLLLGEARRRGPAFFTLLGTGIAGLGLCLLAVLRPSRVTTRDDFAPPADSMDPDCVA